jgi:epoxyqueuosine reductase
MTSAGPEAESGKIIRHASHPALPVPETATAATDPELVAHIGAWARELGFQQVGIADLDLREAGARLREWLDRGFHGTMNWMARHGELRARPDLLVPGTVSAICVRMDYRPADTRMIAQLRDGEKAYVSRYALGRDYHKIMRTRLATLAERIAAAAGCAVIQRPFVDSAPVLEKPLAARAGLGWIGKNTLLLNRNAGSWFFLGELITSIRLPPATELIDDACGKCRACLSICPTQAFPEPYVLDARRCISYLTIEHAGPIPVALRAAMGNRVFGCDDCQIVCPWNRFAKPTDEAAFRPRHGLADAELATLAQWTETEFLDRTAGSPIRRIGHERWLRNLAVGLGNAPTTAPVLAALAICRDQGSELVREHADWALARHGPSRGRVS